MIFKQSDFYKISEDELKTIEDFLFKSEIIFHPVISPKGTPTLGQYFGREKVLILDRNILVLILDLVQKGTLKDKYRLKQISSLLVWCIFNDVLPTAGLALMEHSHVLGISEESVQQHNIFRNIYSKYSIKDWFELAIGKKCEIPIKTEILKENPEYKIYNEHQTLNYIQVLKLCQLLLGPKMSLVKYLREFHKWSYENTLIGVYSTFHAILFLKKQTKLSRQLKELDFNQTLKNCKNVAWDLSYLSFWSTLYWNDKTDKKVYLFATRDKEVKSIFKYIYNSQTDPYINILGKEIETVVKKDLESIFTPRPKRKFDKKELKELMSIEEMKLKNYLLTKSDL